MSKRSKRQRRRRARRVFARQDRRQLSNWEADDLYSKKLAMGKFGAERHQQLVPNRPPPGKRTVGGARLVIKKCIVTIYEDQLVTPKTINADNRHGWPFA